MRGPYGPPPGSLCSKKNVGLNMVKFSDTRKPEKIKLIQQICTWMSTDSKFKGEDTSSAR